LEKDRIQILKWNSDDCTKNIHNGILVIFFVIFYNSRRKNTRFVKKYDLSPYIFSIASQFQETNKTFAVIY